MATPQEISVAHQRRQRSLIMALIGAILGWWRRIDRDRLTESWQAGIGPGVVQAMARTQVEVAALVPGYLRDLAEAQSLAPPELEVVPEAFSGTASDGRPLESLMYQPVIALKRLLADGVPIDEAMRRATAHMTMIAATQAADAGRGAVDAGMTAQRQWVMYVRVVNLPACSRCIVLAGRVYSHSTGFARHPNCDCGMMPVTSDDVDVPSPRDLFDQMSSEEQDRRFGKAGAEAVRLGADLGQVVNARRGMQTAAGRLVTTSGTSRRGAAGRRLRGQVRLMPETIIAEAGGDRDAAIRALRDNGYLLDRPTSASGREQVTVPRPREPEPAAEPQRTGVPAAARPYHRSLDGVEALASMVDGAPVGVRRLGGSSAVTELITLPGGAAAIRKAARPGEGELQDADAEQLTAMVGRALGLRAPAVYRSGGSSIWMEYIADGETAEEAGAWAGQLPDRFAGVPDSDEGRLLGLLDVLTHNADRNDGNWMLTSGGDLVPIDHGMAYGEIITPAYKPSLEFVNSVFADHYKGGTNPLTAEDVAEVRTRLEALRPDFDLLERGHWLDYSLRMLDRLGEAVSGARNLVAGVR